MFSIFIEILKLGIGRVLPLFSPDIPVFFCEDTERNLSTIDIEIEIEVESILFFVTI